MAMQLKDGGMWEPTEEQIQKWIILYPTIEVLPELNAMVGWLDANPTKRKTSRGMSRFCNAWLKRAADRGGSGMVKEKGTSTKTRDMSSLDDLTDNFIDCPNIRAHFLEKFGQVFENGERHTQ